MRAGRSESVVVRWRARGALAALGLALLFGCGAPEPAPEPLLPVLELGWDESTALAGDFAPTLAPLGNGFGLAFDGALETRYELAPAQQETIRFDGGFTVVATLRLDARPTGEAAVISRWQSVDGGRSWELGVDRTQQPYLVVSGTGLWDDGARRVVSLRQLRLGVVYQVAAVFRPGERMALAINGRTTRETGSHVPARVHDGPTTVLLGNRPGDEDEVGFTGVLGRVLMFDYALGDDSLLYLAVGADLDDEPSPFPPVRPLTSDPGFHWFGYFDKLEMDPGGRYVLGMEVGFESRSPTPDDVIRVGMVDTASGDAWVELGETRAWNWQQGCMLQWRPGSDTEVLWNDRDGEGAEARFVTRILDVTTDALRTVDRAVYHVSPDGRYAVGTDFARIDHQRPGYGYAGIPDPNADVPAPADSTIYRVDLETGLSEDLFSLADIAAIPHPDGDFSDAMHRFNHLQWSPGGTRFLFYHRWRTVESVGYTRVFTAAADGSDVRLLTDEYGLSHYIWQDERTVCIWTAHYGGYALYDIDAGYVGTLFRYDDGHQSYLPGGQWLLADTYADGDGNRNPYLYNLLTDEIVVLGHFYTPASYGAAEWRVDAHPRLSPDGTRVVIDSPHVGGRQLYEIDISGIVGD